MFRTDGILIISEAEAIRRGSMVSVEQRILERMEDRGTLCPRVRLNPLDDTQDHKRNVIPLWGSAGKRAHSFQQGIDDVSCV